MTKEAKAPAEPKGPAVGAIAIEAIKAGKTNAEALAAVKAAIPTSKATPASINWYRNKLRADGDKSVPTARELAKAAKAKAAASADPLAS